MSRGAGRALRLDWLRQRLLDRPSRAAELAFEAEVDRRTIERDLLTLQSTMGADLQVDERTHRYWIPSKVSSLNMVEALATYSAARMLVHTGSGGNHYRDAMRKLARLVPEPAKTALMRQVEALQTGPDDRSLELVARAWFGGHVLRCDYLSASRDVPLRRDLEIHFFELNRRNHEAYVIAYDRTSRKDVAVFKLARMSNLQILEETYEPPADFDPATFFGSSYGVVVGAEVWVTVRVEASAARAFRERADDGMVIDDELEDGALRARVRGTLDGFGRALELQPFLLTWGDQIEVLDPPSVREAIATTLLQAATRYTRAGAEADRLHDPSQSTSSGS